MKALILAIAITLAGCSTKYSAYHGAKIVEGKGGAVSQTDGIDFWDEGEPPRKYQVIGVISDSRPEGFAMAARRSQIAKLAKKHGGDAVGKTMDHRQFEAMSTTSNTYGTATANAYRTTYGAVGYGTANATTRSTSIPTYRRNAKYYVIKYK